MTDPYEGKTTIQIMLEACSTLQDRYQEVQWQISPEEVWISVANIAWSADEVISEGYTGDCDEWPEHNEKDIRGWVIEVTEKALDSDSWRNPG